MATVGTPAAKPAVLADAVSQIVMRRQMLDSMNDRIASSGRREMHSAPSRIAERSENGSLIRRLEKLATDADNLHREDGTYRAMSEVAAELQRLRDELYAGGRTSFESSFDELRDDFSQLRQMIGQRVGAETIATKLQAVSAALANLTEAGADRATLNSLRSELEEIRHVFRHMPVDPAPRTVEEPWRAMESRYAAQLEENVLAKVELKSELERLRESLRSLAREDQVQAVEARWDALEKRLDHDGVETGVQALTERMATIEAKLDELPGSLDRTALEDRVRALAENFETLLERGGIDPQQFVAMEERLDEIAGAIVAIHDAAGIDALTIDRIEGRIEALATRVEEIAGDQNVDVLSQRVAELSARVEEMAKADGAAGAELAKRVETLTERFEVALTEFEPREVDLAAIELRISGLAERFEAAVADIEVPAVDTSAIEARLGALAARLEESAAEPRVDGEVVRSLEAQIERLSESLTRVGGMQENFEADFEQRLQVMEQRLEEHREMLIDAAREIADETARRMQVFGEAKQAEHVLKLSESLQSLEKLSRDSDGRSTQVFEAVHNTLTKIVNRLELIEAELGEGKATAKDAGSDAKAREVHAVAPKVELRSVPKSEVEASSPAPISLAERAREALAVVRPPEDQPASLDMSNEIDREEMNRPLEPGSGTPDIGSLLERVRTAQRSRAQGLAKEADDAETRAVALEAAKAASEEIGKLRASSDAELEAPGGLRGLIARRRKAIVTGIVAVLVALSALPVGKIVMGDDQGASTLAALEGLVGTPKMVEDSTETALSVPPVMTEAPMASADATPALQEPAATVVPGATPKESAAETATATGATPKLSTDPKPSEAPAALPATSEASPASETPADPQLAAAATSPAVDASKAQAPTAQAAVTEAPAEDAPAESLPAAEASAPVAPVAEAASVAPAAAVSSASLLDSVRGKLPASARELPPVPDGVGPAKLVEAARSGDAKATFEIGLRMMEGRGGKPDPKAALDWFAQSALKGFAPAQYSIGTLYEKGNGIARDTEAARDWYTLAADGGNVRAMHNLAVLYATGIDGRSQPEVAGRWFQRAADHGMRDSQYNLGILYARGSGVPRDLVQSYKWFGVVADSGDADAATKRDEVGRNLTQDQLRQAKEAVRTFTPETRSEGANTVDTPSEWQERPDQTSAIDMTKAIRNIQAILGKLGYDAGTPDGKVGDKTRSAISAFQKDNKLAATGEIDGPLIRALLQRKNG